MAILSKPTLSRLWRGISQSWDEKPHRGFWNKLFYWDYRIAQVVCVAIFLLAPVAAAYELWRSGAPTRLIALYAAFWVPCAILVYVYGGREEIDGRLSRHKFAAAVSTPSAVLYYVGSAFFCVLAYYWWA
jgi:hypothetical protein